MLWLAEAIRTIYTEIVYGYTFSINCFDEEHEAACTCDNCIYLLLTISLEEYLEGDEISRFGV
jgi:hypothetical protein